MIQAKPKPLSLTEFLEVYPEDGKRYELVDGQIIEIMATRAHDDIADLILFSFNDEIRRSTRVSGSLMSVARDRLNLCN